jgi:hypothetical protein
MDQQQQLSELKAKLAVMEGQQEPAQEQPEAVREWDSIPDDDAEVMLLMERVEGEEFLRYWPEHRNRSLEEAKEIVYLRRLSRDATKSTRERSEAENAIMAIRMKLRGDK